MSDQNEQLKRQLATLQAQLRQVEGERDHAKKMEAVQKEVADNQTWHVQKLKDWRDTVTLALQRPGGARFEDVPEHIKALVRELTTLRQLEEALQERKEFIADCDTALDRIQAPRTNEGQEELVSTWRRIELLGKLLYQYRQELERSAPTLRAENARLKKEVADNQTWHVRQLRQLVEALPVYKDVSISHRVDENDFETWKVWVDHNPLAECDTEGEANAIKGLLQYRATLDATTPDSNQLGDINDMVSKGGDGE